MQLRHLLVVVAVLGTVSVASAGQRWEVAKTSTDTHKLQRVACLRATEFAEATLVAECRGAKGRLTIVEGKDCSCVNHGEFTCTATAQGYCER